MLDLSNLNLVSAFVDILMLLAPIPMEDWGRLLDLSCASMDGFQVPVLMQLVELLMD